MAKSKAAHIAGIPTAQIRKLLAQGHHVASASTSTPQYRSLLERIAYPKGIVVEWGGLEGVGQAQILHLPA